MKDARGNAVVNTALKELVMKDSGREWVDRKPLERKKSSIGRTASATSTSQ